MTGPLTHDWRKVPTAPWRHCSRCGLQETDRNKQIACQPFRSPSQLISDYDPFEEKAHVPHANRR